MYKVLLIDDEPWIREDLKAIIDWEGMGFRIVGEADNGNEAEFLIKRLTPDVIISDIKMSGMTGLELLKRLKRNKKEIITIFLSAYSEFEYAQEAIRLGAVDYILKPVEKDKISALLSKVKMKLDKLYEEEKNNMERDLMQLFLNIIFKENRKRFYIDMSNYSFASSAFQYFIMVVKTPLSCEEQIDKLLKEDAGLQYLYLPIGKNRNLYFFYYTPTETFDHKLKRFYIQLCRLGKKLNIHIGVSETFKTLEELGKYYKQADLIAESDFLLHRNRVNLFRDSRQIRTKVKAFLDKVMHGSEMKTILDDFEKIIKCSKINIMNVAEMYNQIMQRFFREGVILSNVDEIGAKDLINLYENSKQLLNDLWHQWEEGNIEPNISDSGNSIDEIISYVQKHYNQKLILSDIAEKHYLNSSYVGILFKKKTGKKFSSYLLDIRMDKATELLEQTTLSAYEISEMVGYDDYFHFSKLFKKYKNVPPTEYRKLFHKN